VRQARFIIQCIIHHMPPTFYSLLYNRLYVIYTYGMGYSLMGVRTILWILLMYAGCDSRVCGMLYVYHVLDGWLVK